MVSRRVKIAAGVAGLVALAVPLGLSQGGGTIDVFVGSTPTPVGGTCDQTFTTSSNAGNIRADMAALTSGQTGCLQAGAYTWSGGALTKTSLTTIQRAAGVARSAVTIGSIDLAQSHYVKLDGLTITGSVGIGTWTSGTVVDPDATHVVISNSDISNTATVGIENADGTVVIGPGNLFADNGQAYGGFEGRLELLGNCRGAEGTSSCPGDDLDHTSYGAGPLIDGNTFSGTGLNGTGGACTDMIQSTYGANGWTVSNNKFQNFNESGCGATHGDVIQPYTAKYYTITRNWLDNFSEGIENGDCNGPAIFSHNVLTNALDGGNSFRVTGNGRAYTIDHNTLLNGAQLTFGSPNCDSSAMTNVTITNNVLDGETLWFNSGGVPQFGAPLSAHVSGTWNWNMTTDSTSGVRGANGINTSTWSFVGGATPTTWAGYDLASASNGYHAGQSSASIGINP